MAGYSARELSELAGCGLTRGVIANIESGRKTDITVDQLIALAAVLAIPPAALALPVDEPYRFVRMSDGEHQRIVNRAHDMIDWFEGSGTWFKTTSPLLQDNPSTRFATERIVKMREYIQLDRRVERLKLKVEAGEIGQSVVDDALQELSALRRDLQQLEVDLTVYTIDDEDASPHIRLLARQILQTLTTEGSAATVDTVRAAIAELVGPSGGQLSVKGVQELTRAVIELAESADG